MIFLGGLTKITEGKSLVTFIHYQPFDEQHGLGKTQNELQQEGVLVDSIPAAEQNGKTAHLFINPETRDMWYEYTEATKPVEDQIEELKQQNATMQETINYLLGI